MLSEKPPVVSTKEHGPSEQGWAGDGGLIRWDRCDKWGRSDCDRLFSPKGGTFISLLCKYFKISDSYKAAWS